MIIFNITFCEKQHPVELHGQLTFIFTAGRCDDPFQNVYIFVLGSHELR